MARRKHGDAARGLFFSALSRRSGADVSGTPQGDLRGMLLAAFGSSRRDPSRPDTRAAAAALGVTQRTVQRWLAGPERERSKPKPQTLAQIAQASRKAATTKAGRRAAIAATRKDSRIARRGMRIVIHGIQGLQQGPDYERDRKTVMQLTPENSNGFFDAYESGGENGALSFLVDHCDEVYGVDSWYFGEIKGIDLGPMG